MTLIQCMATALLTCAIAATPAAAAPDQPPTTYLPNETAAINEVQRIVLSNPDMTSVLLELQVGAPAAGRKAQNSSGRAEPMPRGCG